MSHGMDVSTLNRFNPTSALLNSGSMSVSNSSMSWMSGLNDLKMIQGGAYKKALKSVYDKQSKEEVQQSVNDAIGVQDFSDKEQVAKSLYNADGQFDALF